ncbi:MAG TPA: ABC transporter substrate-binding protein [Dehalococcoidia bacterium]|nr:ABC transporter substrate-binding protein [Dehalococcoidia bacterium]
MSEKSYWITTQPRLTRRRLLRGGAGLGLSAGALALLGCGGDSGDTKEASSLASKPADTTSKAVRGGVLQAAINADPAVFDVIGGGAPDVPHPARVYSRIIKYQAYKYPDPVQPVAAPDAAASWETSPDGLQVTYKMRPNLKFDPRPPTNGRAVTAQDVKYSADRFMRISPQRAVLSNALSPDAAITSFEAPDANTLVIKLAYPYAPIHMLIAAWRYIVVMPTESESAYDFRTEMRGSGAWRLKSYQRNVRYEYERNPDWYDADKVKLDGLAFTVIPEQASTLAQFRAGALWSPTIAGTVPSQDDVLQLKADFPALTMVPQEEFSAGGSWIRFGYLPGSPFRDERVRKAASMSLDRDLFIATFGNVEKFEKAGLSVPSRWNSAIYSGESFWLNPKDEKTFGEHAKWYKFDPAEAKKLVSAAGHSGAIETKWHYPVGFFAPPFERKMEVLHAMWQDSGNFKLAVDAVTNYNANYQAPYTNGMNKWEGIASAATAARAEVDVLLHEYVKSEQIRSGHLDDGKPDTVLDDLVAKQRVETDTKKREVLIQDVQKRVASKMYYMMEPGQALGFNMAWPWLQNLGLWRSKSGGSPDQENYIYYWYDESKKKA